jgi:uncharacterized membrane protein (GlpM family)
VLALKLLLVPVFIGLVSLAGKRWGPSVAGWLAGFPVVAGPILFFLAIEQGPQFAAQAAATGVLAVLSLVTFGVAYSWASLRLAWFFALLLAVGAWVVASLVLAQFPANPGWSLALAVAGLLLAPRLFPPLAARPAAKALPKREVLLRMGAGAALTLLVTTVAASIGTAWTGLLTLFPVVGTVLAVFSHRANGSAFVVPLLRGMAMGFYAIVAFCFALALLLQTHGISFAFCTSLVLAVAVHWGARAGPQLLRLARR